VCERVCLADHKRLFSPLDCSLWTVKASREGGRGRERETKSQPTLLRQGLIERTKEQGGKDSAFAASTIAVR